MIPPLWVTRYLHFNFGAFFPVSPWQPQAPILEELGREVHWVDVRSLKVQVLLGGRTGMFQEVCNELGNGL